MDMSSVFNGRREVDGNLFRHRWLALGGVIGILVGCGPGGPKTYSVKGKVVTAKAEDLKRLVAQAVELQSTVEPNTRGFGQIQADGTFTISTYRLGAALSGAIEGTHRARIAPTAHDDDDGRGRLRVDRKYTRFDSSGWEIVVPTTGEVVLKLP